MIEIFDSKGRRYTEDQFAAVLDELERRAKTTTTPHKENSAMNPVRKIKLNEAGEQLPEGSTEKHVAVLFPDHGVIITRTHVSEESAPQAECEVAAKGLTLLGRNDWQLVDDKEAELVIDRTHRNPACDPDFFDLKSDWYWTRQPVVGSPSLAWGIHFDGGVVGGNYRDGRGFALASCRVGQ